MTLSLFAAWLGASFGAGVNPYAMVAALGWAHRLGWVGELPGQLTSLAHPAVSWASLGLYGVGFLLDKVPRLDTVGDAMQTFVRPPVSALLSFLIMDGFPLWMRVGAALAGGGLGFAAHSTKASIRFVANSRRQPAFNIGLSLAEDGTVLVLAYCVLFHPTAALVLVGAGCLAMLLILPRVLFAFLRAVNRTLDVILLRARKPS